jgi:uncharacterized phiE125 gp8 family phage protein
MTVKLVTAPTTEPLTLSDAKLYMHIDHTDEDSMIQSFITASRDYIETFTRRTLPITEWELILDSFPEKIVVPKPPLQSVTSITYKNKDGSTTTMSETDYIVDDESEPGKIIPADSWPDVELYPVNAVRVRYSAGYDNVPEVFNQAIKLLVSHMYENREIVREGGQNAVQIPFTVDAMIYPHRAGWF